MQNIVKQDPGRARENSYGTAGTNFLQPCTKNFTHLCISSPLHTENKESLRFEALSLSHSLSLSSSILLCVSLSLCCCTTCCRSLRTSTKPVDFHGRANLNSWISPRLSGADLIESNDPNSQNIIRIQGCEVGQFVYLTWSLVRLFLCE